MAFPPDPDPPPLAEPSLCCPPPPIEFPVFVYRSGGVSFYPLASNGCGLVLIGTFVDALDPSTFTAFSAGPGSYYESVEALALDSNGQLVFSAVAEAPYIDVTVGMLAPGTVCMSTGPWCGNC